MVPSFFISTITDLPESLAWRSRSLKQQPHLLSLLCSLKACYSDCSIITCICLLLSTVVATHSNACTEQSASVPTLTSSQVVLRKAILYRPAAGSPGWLKVELCAGKSFMMKLARIHSGGCVFSTLVCLLLAEFLNDYYFRRRHSIMSAWKCVCVLMTPERPLYF